MARDRWFDGGYYKECKMSFYRYILYVACDRLNDYGGS